MDGVKLRWYKNLFRVENVILNIIVYVKLIRLNKFYFKLI